MDIAKALVGKEDDSLVALGLMLTVWEECAECGVASELIAYAAIYTALTDLVADYGEDAVADLMTQLAGRVRNGEFSVAATLQ
ncbi:MAG: hypothetical protein AAGG99_08680 [Pseudomonadota bacterium]